MQYGKSRKSEDRVIILLWLKKRKRHTFINDGTTCSNTVIGSTNTISSLLEQKNVKTARDSQHLYQSWLGSKILDGLRQCNKLFNLKH